MMMLSALGVLLFGLPVLAASGFTYGIPYSLGGLLMFFGLEKLFTASNLVGFFYWLWQLFV
jgi:hypothetical protein